MEFSPGPNFDALNDDTILLPGITANYYDFNSTPRQFTRKQSHLQLRPT
jgi:hypothetical protein